MRNEDARTWLDRADWSNLAAAMWGLALLLAPGHALATTPTEIAVSVVSPNTGAAQYTVPIDVPPGPGGFQPKLSLRYSSHHSDGPWGVGWNLSLDGQSIGCSIRFGAPDYANCPRYELGGRLLTEDLATPNRYHTLVEGFSRIIHGVALTCSKILLGSVC